MFKSIVTIIGALMIYVLTFFYLETKKTQAEMKELKKISSKSPPCLQMYYYLEKYSEMYGIPKKYAYGVAWKETRYQGPFHWTYSPHQESFAGAVGPMQIMPATATYVSKRWIDKKTLKNNIELNVETSMKILKHLYLVYKDWKIAFGAYNTGKPMINQYALDVYNYNLEKIGR